MVGRKAGRREERKEAIRKEGGRRKEEERKDVIFIIFHLPSKCAIISKLVYHFLRFSFISNHLTFFFNTFHDFHDSSSEFISGHHIPHFPTVVIMFLFICHC